MKIDFVWDWPSEDIQTLTWQDGLAAALKELLARGHEVRVFTSGLYRRTLDHPYFPIGVTDEIVAEIKAWTPDVILHWGDFTRPHAKPLKELGIPMAICFAGGAIDAENNVLFDHIFVESEVYKEKLEHNGFDNVSIAFGTNTELFKPLVQPKIFDTIFPATFALWKRHDLYAPATKGLRSLAVGYMYNDHEQECWQVCLDNDVAIMPHVSAEALHYLYAMSKICVITSKSNGGSQRTVLEAMAMNLPVIVTDSDKFDFAAERVYHCDPNIQELRAYIDTLLDGEPDINTREYVVNNWSEVSYADSLEAGLKAII